MGILLKLALPVVIFVGILLVAPNTHAASLSSLSDTITTSRTSPSSPLSATAASGSTNVSIYDNKSRFLASDSAKIITTATGVFVGNAVTVASQSAALTKVFFVGATSAGANADAQVLMTAISAMHTLQFRVPNSVPASGKIVLRYPTLATGDANNAASPSATTFQLNTVVTGTGGRDLVKAFDDSTDITANVTITSSNPSAGTSPTITLTLDGSTTIAADSVVKVYLGCSTATSSSCSVQSPKIINPTKTAAAGTGDSWVLSIVTQDSGSIDIDTGRTAIATIESVQVYANVDPTLNFSITGIGNATAINTGNATGCTNTETTNSGVAATSTVIDLGTLNLARINIAAQRINITTNAVNGYALTATSSGSLINPSTGFNLQDDPTLPGTALTAGTTQYGFHACGLDVNGTNWGTGATGGGTGALYAWPTATAGLTLASDSTGPITGSGGNGITSVGYAATIDANVPAGTYQTVVTYVATATF